VLYVSGEESDRQIKMRADRLHRDQKGTPRSLPGNLLLVTETNLETILAHTDEIKPGLLIVDSIQTTFHPQLESSAGSISQVRESASILREYAKRTGTSIFLIGHVTKEGTIAGPRVLEHIVDAVLYLEGDRYQAYRLLRTVKNRFGATSEVGVFEMQEQGLREVSNPSELFLAERPKESAGSAVVASLEGSRPLLVELQALVTNSSFGTPQRTSIGIDHKRVALLIAILEKKVELSLAGQDIFLNVAGGVRLNEPAVDLAVIAALASSHLNRVINPQLVLFGEIGLTGEVRAISQPELRVNEAARLGFTQCVLPKGNLKNIDTPDTIELIGVTHASEALDLIFT